MAQKPEAVSIIALKNAATELREALDAAELVATDNEEDWWSPLTELPVDQINPVQLSLHAQEGSKRARAALLLLRKALPLAEHVERVAHSIRVV